MQLVGYTSNFYYIEAAKIIFQRGWTILHSYKQHMRVSILPHCNQHLICYFLKF